MRLVKMFLFTVFGGRNGNTWWKTKRKEKDGLEEGKQYLQDDFVRQRVTDVNFDSIVELPSSMDLQEWLATNTIQFFDHINQLYGAISDYCTTTGCTCMTAPNNVQYQWVDDKGKKIKCAAPQYIDYVMLYAQKTICDEAVFPTKYGNVFPSSFEATIKKVDKLLLHVLAHLYHSHFRQVVTMNLHSHLNTVTTHFLLYCKHFQLVDDKEMEVLDDLYKKLTSVHVKVIGKDDSKTSLSSTEMEPPPPPMKSGIIPATPPNSQSSTPEKGGARTGMDLQQTQLTDSEENKENVISSSLAQCHQQQPQQANGQARQSQSST